MNYDKRLLHGAIVASLCGLATTAVMAAEDTDALRRDVQTLQNDVGDLKQEIQVLRKMITTLMDEHAQGTAPSAPLRPVYVRAVTDGISGFNHANPAWSHDGELLGFERSDEHNREIVITHADGSVVKTVAYHAGGDDIPDMDLILPGFSEAVNYNAGLTWSPGGDRFVFMSNGAEGNYDLYLGQTGNDTIKRLTTFPQKDGQAAWSPSQDRLLYVSGQSGGAQVYLMDLANNQTNRITAGDKSYLYPQWSPDGQHAALIYGSNEDHDVYVIDDLTQPLASLRAITSWRYDDLRPTWSPDGSKIAFYTNYNSAGDPRSWSMAVVDATAQALTEDALIAAVVATDVVPDIDRGPTWLPDGHRLAYVKNDAEQFNPIHVVDTQMRTDRLVDTGTRINHDVSCSTTGLIAFRAQVDQWDHIFVAKLADDEGSETGSH